MSTVFICPQNESPRLSPAGRRWRGQNLGGLGSLLSMHPAIQPQEQQRTNDAPSPGIQERVATLGVDLLRQVCDVPSPGIQEQVATLGVDLLRQVCGNKQNGCLPLSKQDPSSHHCF